MYSLNHPYCPPNLFQDHHQIYSAIYMTTHFLIDYSPFQMIFLMIIASLFLVCNHRLLTCFVVDYQCHLILMNFYVYVVYRVLNTFLSFFRGHICLFVSRIFLCQVGIFNLWIWKFLRLILESKSTFDQVQAAVFCTVTLIQPHQCRLNQFPTYTSLCCPKTCSYQVL